MSLKFFSILSIITGLAVGSTTPVSANQEMEHFSFGYPFITKLGPAQILTKSIKTRDHHCERDCKGEPTRTGYRIEQKVDDKEFKIADVSLQCNSGLCAFSQTHQATFSNNVAWGSFDVWSRPMTWTLVTTVQPILRVSGDAEQIGNSSVRKRNVFIIERDKEKYIDVFFEAVIPEIGRIRVNPESPPNPFFRLISKAEDAKRISYNIQYLGNGIN